MRKQTFDPTRNGIRRSHGTVNDPFEPKTISCTKTLCNVSSPTPSARNVDHKSTLPPSSFDQKLHSKISSSKKHFCSPSVFYDKKEPHEFSITIQILASVTCPSIENSIILSCEGHLNKNNLFAVCNISTDRNSNMVFSSNSN
jgi:hypothetical protein